LTSGGFRIVSYTLVFHTCMYERKMTCFVFKQRLQIFLLIYWHFKYTTDHQKWYAPCQKVALVYLRQWRKYMFSPARSRSFVSLSVCVQDYSKTRAWIWMKCCMSADVGTRMNWLTVELDPDPGTGFLNFSGILTRYGQISMKFYGPLGLDELIRLGFLNFSGISQEVMDIFRWNLMGR